MEDIKLKEDSFTKETWFSLFFSNLENHIFRNVFFSLSILKSVVYFFISYTLPSKSQVWFRCNAQLRPKRKNHALKIKSTTTYIDNNRFTKFCTTISDAVYWKYWFLHKKVTCKANVYILILKKRNFRRIALYNLVTIETRLSVVV